MPDLSDKAVIESPDASLASASFSENVISISPCSIVAYTSYRHAGQKNFIDAIASDAIAYYSHPSQPLQPLPLGMLPHRTHAKKHRNGHRVSDRAGGRMRSTCRSCLGRRQGCDRDPNTQPVIKE